MQASDWAGAIGDTWAEEWVRTDRTFAPVDAALVAAVAARLAGVTAARILDVGCGAGRTSLSLADALPGVRITGIDLSPALIATARARADAQANAVDCCRFAVADATRWTDEEDTDEDGADGAEFDLIVSRHGVMFFDDPVAALAHIRTRATPGAPLIFSCFRAPSLNPWASGLARLVGGPPSDPHAPGPFAFADEGRVASLLVAAGWHDPQATPLDFAYVAGAGVDPVADAIGFFLRIGPTAFAMRHAEGADRQRLLGGLAALVTDHLEDGRIVFPAAAWIWSATA